MEDRIAQQLGAVQGRLSALEERMTRNEIGMASTLAGMDGKLDAIKAWQDRFDGVSAVGSRIGDWVRPLLVALIGGAGAAWLMRHLGL